MMTPAEEAVLDMAQALEGIQEALLATKAPSAPPVINVAAPVVNVAQPSPPNVTIAQPARQWTCQITRRDEEGRLKEFTITAQPTNN